MENLSADNVVIDNVNVESETHTHTVPADAGVSGADDTGFDVVGAAVIVVAVLILAICLKHPRNWMTVSQRPLFDIHRIPDEVSAV